MCGLVLKIDCTVMVRIVTLGFAYTKGGCKLFIATVPAQ